MIRVARLFFLTFVVCTVLGCGEQQGLVATEDQMKAHVAEHGDLSLDPAASTDLVD